jgi:hypothetical protein
MRRAAAAQLGEVTVADVWGKLNLKDHTEIVVVNAPRSFEREIDALDGGTVKRKPGDVAQIAFFLAFVTTTKDVEALAKIVARKTLPDAVVWFAYPKATSKNYTSEISWETGNEALGDAGFEPVRMVAIDEDWTGKRFRRVAFIKKLTRDPRALVSTEGKKRVARR